uniref:Uncharacterized protein n=1 Tax=Glossina austeni TaxID=7395 RepID=A0A1A9VNS1_GLOAU
MPEANLPPFNNVNPQFSLLNTISVDSVYDLERPYKCTVCSKYFKRQDDLDRDMPTNVSASNMASADSSVASTGSLNDEVEESTTKVKKKEEALILYVKLLNFAEKRFIDSLGKSWPGDMYTLNEAYYDVEATQLVGH